MIAESQIREKLGRYLRRDLSLDHFEDWIVKQSWNMHKDSDSAAQKLASAIELRLAEHSNGHLSESALREELREFVNPRVVQISFGQAENLFSSDEQANNAVVPGAAQVVAFTSRAAPPSPAEYGFFGKSQLVEHG